MTTAKKIVGLNARLLIVINCSATVRNCRKWTCWAQSLSMRYKRTRTHSCFTVAVTRLHIYCPRESFRERLWNHQRTFVCLSVCLFVCLLPR